MTEHQHTWEIDAKSGIELCTDPTCRKVNRQQGRNALSASPVGEGASDSPIPTEGHGAAVVTPDDWWIEWFGGKCPVARRTLVTVRRRDGREVCDMAFKFDWTNENYAGVDSDIVAYRVEAAPSTTSTAEQVDYYPSHEALHDLMALLSEHDVLNGGGPDWAKRWRAALLRAEEILRDDA